MKHGLIFLTLLAGLATALPAQGRPPEPGPQPRTVAPSSERKPVYAPGRGLWRPSTPEAKPTQAPRVRPNGRVCLWRAL
jgi:hypothetical protein